MNSDSSDDHRQPDGRRNRPPPAHPAGEADDEFVLGLQPVERQQRAGEHRDRQDQRHQLRHGQQRHLDQHPRALPALHDQVQLAEAAGEQTHHRERGGGPEHGIGDLPE
jgi:hypothetical protein